MANTNNNISLLIDLGIDTNGNSKQNINEYIKSLKGKLDTVKVDLSVDGLESTNKGFNETNKIINELQEQIKQLKTELKGINKVTPSIDSSNVNRELDSIKDRTTKTISEMDKFKNVNLGKPLETLDKEVIKSFDNLDDLFDYFDKKQIRFKIHENAKGDVSRVVTQIKNELNQIETLTIRPKFDKESKTFDFKTSSVLDDSSTYKLNESLQKSLDKLKDLGTQGALTGNQIEKYIGDLSLAETNSEIANITREFSLLSKEMKELNKEANRLSKVDNEIEKLTNTIEKLKSQGSLSSEQASGFLVNIKSVEKTTEAVNQLKNKIEETANSTTTAKKLENAMSTISPTVDRLNEKLDIMVNKLGSNVDTSKLEKIRNEILAISNTKLKTIDDIRDLNLQLSQTKESITQLGVASNATNKFEDSIRKANKLLDDLERSGYAASGRVEELRNNLNNIPTNDLAQVRTLVNGIESDLREAGEQRSALRLLDEMEEKAHLLESRLERTKNLFRRTFDPTEAQTTANVIANLRQRIEEIRANPIQATTRAMDELRNSARIANTEVASFHANSTTAARSSMGVIESLKTAMEKFPIK